MRLKHISGCSQSKELNTLCGNAPVGALDAASSGSGLCSRFLTKEDVH